MVISVIFHRGHLELDTFPHVLYKIHGHNTGTHYIHYTHAQSICMGLHRYATHIVTRGLGVVSAAVHIIRSRVIVSQVYGQLLSAFAFIAGMSHEVFTVCVTRFTATIAG